MQRPRSASFREPKNYESWGEGCKIGTVGRMRKDKFKVQIYEGKVMTNVFWSSEGILLVEFLNRAATVNSER
jgi:hypothetical protein